MPSPFPGMDPYLEGSLWTTIHVQLSAEIARQLAPRLRPRYLALTAERFVREAAGAPTVVPDVTVEIRDVPGRRLIAVLEVLSHARKQGNGRQEYLTMRRALTLSNAHLIEIDLLHEGCRVPMQQPLPPAPYYVLVSRARARPFMGVWPIQLADSLPVISVPLSLGDADVPLDLQQALTTVYDLLGYDLAVNYAEPPETPLPPAEAEWLDQRLRAAGLRGGPPA